MTADKKDVNLKVLKVIEDIENMVEKAPSVPVMGKIMIDRDEMLDFLNEINILLPKEYQHVRWIDSQSDKIMEDTNRKSQELMTQSTRKSQNIIENAKSEETRILESAAQKEQEILLVAEQKARQMLSDHEITRNAENYAREILSEAQQTSDEIMKNSYDYVEQMMLKVEGDLKSSLEVIHENLMELQQYKK